ncbi:hypothetical protein [Labrenzia sp. DG1229]|uniref:hypothetical protein n=1 Tax=Labrenzia sp. DG1229 TaxID=681847 RepID=UPI001AD8ED83|nr:hypothetical protein [Labrenzia sp. DG1229]
MRGTESIALNIWLGIRIIGAASVIRIYTTGIRTMVKPTGAPSMISTTSIIRSTTLSM